MAIQVPTPDDTVINELDARALHYLRTSLFKATPHLNLVQKTMAYYGPTTQSPSLRFAILSTFEQWSPFRGQPGAHLISAANVVITKPISSLDEGDVLAIAILCLIKRDYICSSLSGRDAVLHRLPSFSIICQKFISGLKTLFDKSGGRIISDPFAGYWRFMMYMVMSPPWQFVDDTIWELLALIRQHFGVMDLDRALEDVERLNTGRSLGHMFSETYYRQSAYFTLVNWNAAVASQGFWNAIDKDRGRKFGRMPLMLFALNDIRACIIGLESTSVHLDLLLGSPTRWFISEGPFGLRHGLAICYITRFFWTKLVLALVLDGVTFRQAAITRGAYEAADAFIFLVKFYLSYPIPLLCSSDHPFEEALNSVTLSLISDLLVAALVHPISNYTDGNYN